MYSRRRGPGGGGGSLGIFLKKGVPNARAVPRPPRRTLQDCPDQEHSCASDAQDCGQDHPGVDWAGERDAEREPVLGLDIDREREVYFEQERGVEDDRERNCVWRCMSRGLSVKGGGVSSCSAGCGNCCLLPRGHAEGCV